MTVKAVLFDLDGTLIDSNADLAAAVNFMLRAYGLAELPPVEVKKLLGNGIRHVIESVFARAGKNMTGDEISAATELQMNYYLDHAADFTRPFAGVIELLEELKRRNICTAVVTNKHAFAARKILQLLQMDHLFATVCGDGSGDNIALKPEPDLLFLALKEMNVDPQQALMVGDNYTDLGSARRAGIKSVFCTFGYGVKDRETADFEIDNMLELKELL